MGQKVILFAFPLTLTLSPDGNSWEVGVSFVGGEGTKHTPCAERDWEPTLH